MIGSERGFPRCLALALGVEPEELPAPDGDPGVFWRQWLAGRNLGLVPVDDPASFSWPGYWIAAFEGDGGRRDAVLMFEITWEEARRNVVTRGIGLNTLVGHRFRIGDVECVGRRLAEPCAHLQRLAPAGVLSGLVHRGGLRADIVGDGTIRVGDQVAPISEA